jgi:hypothetical protein
VSPSQRTAPTASDARASPQFSMPPMCSYTCVPQMHRPTQELAIASISVYSSRAHAFIAVVPSVRHTETHELCDAHTYQMRLWTRAECLTHLLINGIGSMWIASGANPRAVVPMPAEWLKGSALRIFDGESTCCRRQHAGGERCDRELLVQPLLGMYGKLYAEAQVAGRKMMMIDAQHSSRGQASGRSDGSDGRDGRDGLNATGAPLEPPPPPWRRQRQQQQCRPFRSASNASISSSAAEMAAAFFAQGGQGAPHSSHSGVGRRPSLTCSLSPKSLDTISILQLQASVGHSGPGGANLLSPDATEHPCCSPCAEPPPAIATAAAATAAAAPPGVRASTASLASVSTARPRDGSLSARPSRRSWISRLGLPHGPRHRSCTQARPPLPEYMQAELATFLMVESLEHLIFPKTFGYIQPDGEIVETDLFGDLIRLMKVTAGASAGFHEERASARQLRRTPIVRNCAAEN